MQALIAIAISAGAPVVLVAHAVICGIMKDGSPFRKDWWL